MKTRYSAIFGKVRTFEEWNGRSDSTAHEILTFSEKAITMNQIHAWQ